MTYGYRWEKTDVGHVLGLEGLNCVFSCVIEKMKERDLYRGLFRRLYSYYPIGALTGSKLRNLRCQT